MLVTIGLALAMFATICAFAAGVSRAALRFGLVLGLLLLPSASHAEDHDRTPLGIANFTLGTTYIGLSAADAIITYRAVSDGRAREANPLLVPFVESHGIGKTMAAKFAVNVGTELGLRYIEHRWPERQKTVLAARIAAVAVQGYVVARNLRVLRESR